MTRGRSALPLALAGFATLGFILEVLVVEEVLFSRRKDEFGAAVGANQHPILKLRHG